MQRPRQEEKGGKEVKSNKVEGKTPSALKICLNGDDSSQGNNNPIIPPHGCNNKKKETSSTYHGEEKSSDIRDDNISNYEYNPK